ncbi:unnamed protein product [Dimorphilus gyrociliatus]|uniref:Uncharacterized protein n=1 Tax=Dimorphilus gyrociliatus TaxID=2664684 RepID=A0A7I8WDC5_9ANNE|nr:unnamed protein product [Dimorphilus gyrociliatus]
MSATGLEEFLNSDSTDDGRFDSLVRSSTPTAAKEIPSNSVNNNHIEELQNAEIVTKNGNQPIVVSAKTNPVLVNVGSTNVGTLPTSMLAQSRSPTPKKVTGAIRSQIQIVTVAGGNTIGNRNSPNTPQRVLAPRTVTSAPIRIAPQARQQTPGLVLPQSLGQNALIMKSEQGQWVLLQGQTGAQIQQRPVTTTTVRVSFPLGHKL